MTKKLLFFKYLLQFKRAISILARSILQKSASEDIYSDSNTE